jgi:hypothetical protein
MLLITAARLLIGMNMSVWGDVNTVLYKLCKGISEWSVVWEKVGNFQIQLERNEFLETTHGVWSPAGDVYAKSHQFLSLILPKCQEAYEANHSVFTELEAEHAKLLRESNDKITQFRMNVRLHLIHTNSVYIYISFVVSFSAPNLLKLFLSHVVLPSICQVQAK